MKHIGICCATYNEVSNVENLYEAIKKIFDDLGQGYTFTILFIDNCSGDGTREVLLKLSKDSRVACIFNRQNYGANRSSFHGMLQCPGDAVIMMCADFQDPPEILPKLIEQWSKGNEVVMARKQTAEDGILLNFLRSSFYRLLAFSNPIYASIQNCTGFGIYDRDVIEVVKQVDDKYPFFRGIIAEICNSIEYVDYHRPNRSSGKSAMGIMKLWDEGVQGLMNSSKLGLRLISIFGLTLCVISIVGVLIVLSLKLIFWDAFPIGIAPILLIQLLSLGCVMLALGVIGEYVGGVYSQTLGRACVYEAKRINL